MIKIRFILAFLAGALVAVAASAATPEVRTAKVAVAIQRLDASAVLTDSESVALTKVEKALEGGKLEEAEGLLKELRAAIKVRKDEARAERAAKLAVKAAAGREKRLARVAK